MKKMRKNELAAVSGGFYLDDYYRYNIGDRVRDWTYPALGVGIVQDRALNPCDTCIYGILFEGRTELIWISENFLSRAA